MLMICKDRNLCKYEGCFHYNFHEKTKEECSLGKCPLIFRKKVECEDEFQHLVREVNNESNM